LYDTERGVGKILKCDRTAVQSTSSNGLTSFNSNGFTLGTDVDGHGSNPSGEDLASWTFRKAPGFFDVVTYTGNGTAGRTVSHSLGSVPGMIIVKRTDSSNDWAVYHRSTFAYQFLKLNTTASAAISDQYWYDTNPTSSVFTVGAGAEVNASGGSYVAYIFAHDDASFGTDEDESIIKCGSYTGTGSSNNTVNLGFEPQWVMIKGSDNVSSPWWMFDNMRGVPTGGADAYLRADDSAAESDFELITFNSTGFSIEGTGSTFNNSGSTYIYMAIRRPNKPPEAATEVFAIDTGSGSSIPNWDSGFPVDASWTKSVTAAGDPGFFTSRLIGSRGGYTHYANAEHADSGVEWDSNVGWGKNYGSGYISFMFKRAPGFFDVVAYTGTGSAQNVTHNLDAVPELIIVKARDVVDHWQVYSSVTDETDFLMLNQTDATSDQASKWNDTAPTSSVFTVNTDTGVNQSTKAYVAYLFATLPGISKVGTYTGTGSANNIDCGFTAGARFVLIKRTDASGDWFVFDTARGIVSGNDFFLKLNSTSAQAGGDDYIDPYAAGFTINGTYSGLNASGGTYIFLAIA
jgi:hypothetical protein